MESKLNEMAGGQLSIPAQEDLLDLEMAADQLCVSKTTLYRMLDRGEIKGIKVGRQWRFRSSDLDAYLARGPVAVALSALPVAVLDAELAVIAVQLAPYEETVPEVAEAGLDLWEEKVQQLLLAIVRLAILQRATDIHLEPAKEGADLYGLLRFRIDGFLQTVHRFPLRVHEALLVRVRVLAAGDAGNTGYLDASLHLPVGEATVDFRISLLASYYGQALSARLLAVSDSESLRLEHLGFHADDLERVKAWMQPQAGIIFVSGPSGSGKTTLLYRLLELVVDAQHKVVSVEDPVEQLLPGVMQIEINQHTRGFAPALRALLRHDADVMMIAELRDLETINLALQAARMGHHVIAPISLDRAIASLHRVVEVFPQAQEPEIRQVMAHTVQGMIGMRLVRLLCPACKRQREQSKVAQDELAALAAACGAPLPQRAAFYQPAGCPQCAHTGYRGRTGLYEVIEMTAELRAAFLRAASREELAQQQGMRTLATEALRKAVAGLISLDEAMPILRRYAQPVS